MHPNIDELLALQSDDNRISGIEQKLAALSPRLRELDRLRQQAADAVQRAEANMEGEQQRQRDIQARVELHKKQQERNLAQLDSIKKMKEATAAMSQVETTRRLVAEDESELAAMGRRMETMRADIERTRAALAAAEQEQASARDEIAAEQGTLDAELKEARAERQEKAAKVDRALLHKYDRIRSRRENALYPLRGQSCGNCDTAVPMQRRNIMTANGTIEVCEGCGVLLYPG
ncbi:MAG: zinc ribbon domain-containing protein [Gemmatimonadaceae bacterium]